MGRGSFLHAQHVVLFIFCDLRLFGPADEGEARGEIDTCQDASGVLQAME